LVSAQNSRKRISANFHQGGVDPTNPPPKKKTPRKTPNPPKQRDHTKKRTPPQTQKAGKFQVEKKGVKQLHLSGFGLKEVEKKRILGSIWGGDET